MDQRLPTAPVTVYDLAHRCRPFHYLGFRLLETAMSPVLVSLTIVLTMHRRWFALPQTASKEWARSFDSWRLISGKVCVQPSVCVEDHAKIF